MLLQPSTCARRHAPIPTLLLNTYGHLNSQIISQLSSISNTLRVSIVCNKSHAKQRHTDQLNTNSDPIPESAPIIGMLQFWLLHAFCHLHPQIYPFATTKYQSSNLDQQFAPDLTPGRHILTNPCVFTILVTWHEWPFEFTILSTFTHCTSNNNHQSTTCTNSHVKQACTQKLINIFGPILRHMPQQSHQPFLMATTQNANPIH